MPNIEAATQPPSADPAEDHAFAFGVIPKPLPGPKLLHELLDRVKPAGVLKR